MLQEMTNGTASPLPSRLKLLQTLSSELGSDYTHRFAPTMINTHAEGKVQEGNAIFSKLPIDSTRSVFFSGEYGDYLDIPENYGRCPRNLQHLVLDAGGKKLHVINFHGIWDLNGKDPTAARRTMIDAIMTETKSDGFYIIGGDTNAEADNPVMERLGEKYTTVFGQDPAVTGFNMRRKTNPAYGHVIVDHLYISPEITVLSHSRPDVDISDHLPMIVEIDIPEDLGV